MQPDSSDSGQVHIDLRSRLEPELRRLGKDIDHVPSRAPGQSSAVFDLLTLPTSSGYQLTWTERLVGDYDYNGIVNIGELTPLGAYFKTGLQYDDPLLHSGIAFWPAGDPEQDNGIPYTERPAPGSGAYNWWLSRVDGDSNGFLNLSDLTPIAAHWGEHLDGYRIYRKGPGESQFSALVDPETSEPLLVPRASAGPKAGESGIRSSRPVRYSFLDAQAAGAGYEYRVAPFDAVTGEEGPLSIAGASPITAVVTATPEVGSAPLEVFFDASASTSQGSPIVSYSWDFENDGVPEMVDSPLATATHLYTENGRYIAALTMTDSSGNAVTVGKAISVTELPVAVLTAIPDNGEIPVTVRFDGAQSFDPDGQVVKYEWDLDGNGSFETNTGPVSYREITLTEIGQIFVGLRVTDNYGASATDTLDLPLVDDFDELEPNDTLLQASGLGSFNAGEAISGIRGSIGSASYDGDDVDWYRLETSSGGDLTISLAFAHAAADLSLRLFNSSGVTEVASSLGGADNEQLQFGVIGPGTYLLKVERSVASVGQNADYLLSLSFAALTYDEVEHNDSIGTATDLGALNPADLPITWGNLGPGGLDGDDRDWYRVELGQAATVTVRLAFQHHDADLDLAVFGGSSGSILMGESLSVTDNEETSFAAAAGTYYVRCERHGGGSANYILGFELQ